MQEYLNLFIDGFILAIPKLLGALLIFVVSLYVARILSNILRRVLNKRRAPAGVTHLLAQLTLWESRDAPPPPGARGSRAGRGKYSARRL